jgi:hypothetical protein
MVKLNRDEQLATIFQEWAADFRFTGDLEEAGFWTGISLALQCGSTINADAIERVKLEAAFKASMSFFNADIAKEAMLGRRRFSWTLIWGNVPVSKEIKHDHEEQGCHCYWPIGRGAPLECRPQA